ncbi:MAG: hypothetical protein M3Q69_11525 [Acidobacteriota bacterium]|nr:hypothetical protein [Acidobacteriota bacterium]
MSARQKQIVLLASVLIALTRFAATARTLFDWDEALFVSAVRDYDVTQHHPHPPGYPLFIAAAKAVHAVVGDEFRALQVVVTIGACFLFPALFFLARELGFDFATSALGAALFVFLPNVWLYGGTAFSDVPATTLAFVACALLLRGRKDDRAYLFGALLLGIAAGFRTPNLLIGALPALLATTHRLRAKTYASVACAILEGAAIVLASYAGAALASTGIADYRESLEVQSRYVHDVDSFHNPVRGPLWNVFVAFVLHPFQHLHALHAMELAAAIAFVAAIVRRKRAVLLTVAMFAPLAIVTVLEFDVNAASRYAIGFLAAHALLAAYGCGVLFRSARMQTIACAVLIAVFIYVAFPAVIEQRTADAPSIAALRYAAQHVPHDATLYIHGSMRPHADALLADRQRTYYVNLTSVHGPNAWVIDQRVHEGAVNFVRPRNATWRVLRQRNFEASVYALP